MTRTPKISKVSNTTSNRPFLRDRIALRPSLTRLEDRLTLSLARPSLRAASSAAAEIVAIRGSIVAGTLDIQGTSGADTVEIGRSARGLVTLTVNGKTYSADPRDRGVYDRRLAGLRTDRLRGVRLVGQDPLDTLILNTTLGNGRMSARVQSQAVVIASPVHQAGTFRLEAQTITIAAPVQADSIVMSAKGLLNLDTAGSLTAASGITLTADRLVQTGDLRAPSVTVQANVLIRSGTITAPGGSVVVNFTQNYVATEGAAIDVSGPASGGSIRIDGGATGHLFSSGTLLAKGADSGGAVRVSGKDVVLVAGGVDASGGVSGGLVHIGGGWQGSDASMTKARTLQVSPYTVIQAVGSRQGGTVVLWSETATTNYGTISATGAKGGAVEVSSKASLAHGGSVDVGPGGKFLLDPKNIVIADNAVTGVPQFQLVNPTPSATDNFGASVVPLSTGNVVVTDPGDDSVAANAGAFYLYNGITGALISTVTGSTANNEVGNNVLKLTNGNFVVQNYYWDNGAATEAGAVTWGNGTSGVSGVVSASNSVVGSSTDDYIGGSTMTALPSGNYVIRSANWNAARGAVTWGDGATGTTGVVSASNSLVGSTTGDYVGSSLLTVLSNGNYLVIATGWDNGPTSNAGAVTWGSGTAGVSGVVSASNSLVGSNSGDEVGSTGITTLSNGNYIVRSNSWNGGRRALTWGSGTAGVTGTVSSSNSLVGSTSGDQVGSGGITQLTNGNYVVLSPNWDGTATDAGAVTWGSGTAGVAGVVSAANSLVGSTAFDYVGHNGVSALSNGNYLVSSALWNGNRGAVTWGSGATGIVGVVASGNSLVGSSANDSVGNGDVTALSSENYVVRSPNWNGNRGAVTWGSGVSGVVGTVSDINSLVGFAAGDRVGSNTITALASGNYLVRSPNWNGNRGAVTWGSGITGVNGLVSSGNSLVGSTASDSIGSQSIALLSNGNFVVTSPAWDNGAATDAGAATWGSGMTGISGEISFSNSLVGTSAYDNVGNYGAVALMNGNYVVRSPFWRNDTAGSAGAVTWGSGTSGVTGQVSAGNSLVGSMIGDQVGIIGITALSNGNYVVSSTEWNGARGAVTWGNGTSGVTGAVSIGNSLIGSTANDRVGTTGITTLSNGNFVVASALWNGNRGAVTWASGTSGIVGEVSSSNSLVGSMANAYVGGYTMTSLSNGNYVVRSPEWHESRGAVTWGNGTTGLSGVVSYANSLVGTTANDQVGSGGITVLANGNYIVSSPLWDNGAAVDAGAVTWIRGTDGSLLSGVAGQAVGLTNSFTGSPTRIDDTVNGTYLMRYSASGGSVFAGLPTPVNAMTFSTNPATSANMSPALVATPLSAGTATTLQANNDITLSNALTVNNPSDNGGALTLQAGRSVNLNANLTTDNANLNVLANASASDGVVDAQRDAGNGDVTIASGVTINAGNGSVSLSTGTAAGLTNVATGRISIYGNVTARSVTITTADAGISNPYFWINGTLDLSGELTIESAGTVVFSDQAAVTGMTNGSIATSNDEVRYYGPFSLSGNLEIDTGSGLISFDNAWAIGSKLLTLTSSVAASASGNLSIDGGVVLAMTAGVSVSSTGSLTGNGTFLGQVSVAGGLAPGSGPSGVGSGLLNLATSPLTLAGTTTVTMNGTSKTAFDKVAAIGVNLAGATLALDLSAATLNAGDSITLVDNISASATSGTFAGLAQGALFTANGHTMQISYTGGDGNDVVVTKVGDITADFSFARSGFFYVIATGNYRQTITLTNLTAVPRKPRTFKIVGLPVDVSVVGGSQDGSDWYLNLGDALVPAGGSLGVPVQFVVPSGNAFTYTLEVIGG